MTLAEPMPPEEIADALREALEGHGFVDVGWYVDTSSDPGDVLVWWKLDGRDLFELEVADDDGHVQTFSGLLFHMMPRIGYPKASLTFREGQLAVHLRGQPSI